MDGFPATVWDRLTGAPDAPAGQQHPDALTLAQYKRAIARDLEVLLNTRSAIPAHELDFYPACRESIANFGLVDFAHLCLTSSDDRKEICDRLVATVMRHEPRLVQVRARLLDGAGTVNRLSFVIAGKLRALSADRHVQFDLMLEPSSLKYTIR